MNSPFVVDGKAIRKGRCGVCFRRGKRFLCADAFLLLKNLCERPGGKSENEGDDSLLFLKK